MFWRSYNKRFIASACRFYDNIRNVTRGGSFRACGVYKVANNEIGRNTGFHTDQLILHNCIRCVSHYFITGVAVIPVQSLKCSKLHWLFSFC
ncbi:Uncharacterised protein [Serratia marcescens]|nr:Uncharacterised protein [Serratia marcescens]CAI1919138.1 Uncharacterised protein [Serratia marcescens]